MRKIQTKDMILDRSTKISGVVAIEQLNRLDGFELSGNQSFTVFQGLIEYLRYEARQNNTEQGYSSSLRLPRGRRL